MKETFAELVNALVLGLRDAKHYIMMFDKLCAAGYACLCFDYRVWGDSEGNDRGWVMPKWRAEDIRSALSFMETRPEIDAERLATYGSGGTGGGKAIYVAAIAPGLSAASVISASAVAASGCTPCDANTNGSIT